MTDWRAVLRRRPRTAGCPRAGSGRRGSARRRQGPRDLRGFPKSPLSDSNRRPLPYHGSALPTELRGRKCLQIRRFHKSGALQTVQSTSVTILHLYCAGRPKDGPGQARTSKNASAVCDGVIAAKHRRVRGSLAPRRSPSTFALTTSRRVRASGPERAATARTTAGSGTGHNPSESFIDHNAMRRRRPARDDREYELARSPHG